MSILETTYLGLSLRNPIILGSCGLSSTADGVRKAAAAGAGAVVLKSLFEEQLRAEFPAMDDAGAHPEAAAFLENMGLHTGAAGYLELVRTARREAGIPVIASVNCAGGPWWAEFSRQLEAAGADAIELNVSVLPSGPGESSESIERRLLEIVAGVRAKTKLPLSVKLGTWFTNLGRVVAGVAGAGAAGVVLFNRWYKLDIDLDSMRLSSGPATGDDSDHHESLRWIALLFGRVPCEFAASGGVSTAEQALKLVAAGAHAVQVCSAVYKGGYGAITDIMEGMERRAKSLGLAGMDGLRGRLSRFMSDDPAAYDRLQYMKALTGIS
ncbi:MAG: dihydroorotate dehydrogenase-like protein [Spirochaetes bacterium]|nr:dihydroorotate dehydrogenase-like protein [Spirochaetota bacterium]